VSSHRPRPAAAAIEVAHALAAAAAAAGETRAATLHELAPRRSGRATAEHLLGLAQPSTSSGLATTARATSLKLFCAQLDHPQANLAHWERELDHLLQTATELTGLSSVPEFGLKTRAVWRAALGAIERFERLDPVVASAGRALELTESGQWNGPAKLSKRGSGRLRRILYLAAVRSIRLPDSY